MSLHWNIRISVYTLICGALLAFGLADTTFAQKRIITRPPGAGGPPETGDQEATNDPRRTRPQGRPSSVGNRRGGGPPGGPPGAGDDQSTRTSKPRFVNLLDSKDLSEFRGYAQEEIGEGWSLDGKYLYFDGSGGGDIVTKEVYDDFDLQVEWKVADGANSGIMYRVSLGDDAPYMSGPEYQILDDAEHQDGKNELTAAGSLYGMFAAKDKTLKDVGTWNKTRIVVEGNQVTHYLNGKKVVETEIGGDDWNKQLGESKFKDWEKYGKNKEGHIAFQDHGNEVWFRNIRIKRLNSSDVAGNESSNGRAPAAGQAARNSKFSGMQNSVPGADKDGAPDK